MSKKPRKDLKKRNPMARELADRRYSCKVVPAKKGKGAVYNRNKEKAVAVRGDSLFHCAAVFSNAA